MMRRAISVWAPLLLVISGGPTGAGEKSVGSRTVELTYEATARLLDEATRVLDLWIPVSQTDDNQTIHRLTIDAPGPVSLGREPRFGNQILHLRVARPRGPVRVTLTIVATRRENSGGPGSPSPKERERLLAPEPLVPLDGPVRALALEATRGLSTDAEKARAIYDSVTRIMTYDKSGIGWGRGDALFACDAKRGNCTDFHALIIGMARSVGIPARFAMGLPLPTDRASGEIAGYHCWAELFIEGRGWVPVDASEAAKDPARRDYFFGHHDEHRLEFSRGRHLRLEPSQQGPPLNFFVYPYAEADGAPGVVIDRRFTFRDVEPPVAPRESGPVPRRSGP